MGHRGESMAVVTRVLHVRELRWVEAGFAAFSFSEHATWLAVLVYALAHGGPRQVGIVAVAQLLPGVLLAPFAAYSGDRFPPQRAIAVGYALQSVAMAGTAIAMAAGASLAAYVLGGAAATCITFTRPVMGSLLPGITHAPSDLVAANVVTGFIEQVGVFVGPLAAGLLMAISSPTMVFAAAAGATAFACFAAFMVTSVDAFTRPAELDASTVMSQVLEGFATLRHEGRVRVLVALGASAGLVKGIADVTFVTFADARLDGGGGQSGLLAGAYGLGAMVGAVTVTRLVHTGRVSRQFAVAGLCAAVGLVTLSGSGVLAPALLGFGLLGAGESLLQLTSGVTIQRQAPTRVLARVFGIVEGMRMGAVALGSLAVTLLVATASLGVAFVVLGSVVLLLVLVGVARLQRHGDDAVVVDDALVQRLLADPVFASLPAPTTERLAKQVEPITVRAGEVVVAEGGVGDRYYLIDHGTTRVTIGGREVRTLGPGTSFGEIALLRDVPRTATVTAISELHLLSVSRRAFLEAVTGHPRSHGVASAVTDRLLGD